MIISLFEKVKQFEVNDKLLFILIVSCYVIIGIGEQHLLLTRNAFYNSYDLQIDSLKINAFYDLQMKMAWLGYILLPIIYFAKFSIVSIVLNIGSSIENLGLRFKDGFAIAMQSEFIFFIPLIIKIFWFLFFRTNYTLSDVKNFYPFSLLNLIDYHSLREELIYPFQTINLFEILYWVLLSLNLAKVVHRKVMTMIPFVIKYYVLGLIIWLILYIFLGLITK